MSGSTHPWIFRPSLAWTGHLLMALAGLALLASALAPRDQPSPAATEVVVVNPPDASAPALSATDASGEWPRTALRLWFLLPQLLPRHDH